MGYTIVICGEFNARSGDLVEEEAEDEMPGRRPVDTIKNWQGEALMSYLGNSGLYIVNGKRWIHMCVRKREFSSGLLHTPKGTA